MAYAGGQLACWALGVSVGEGLLGLPANEDGWGADLAIVWYFGLPASIYAAIFFALVPFNLPRRSIWIALATGCLSGLILTGIVSGSEVVAEQTSYLMGFAGLALLLIGPPVGAVLCYVFGKPLAMSSRMNDGPAGAVPEATELLPPARHKPSPTPATLAGPVILMFLRKLE